MSPVYLQEIIFKQNR